MLSTLLSPVNGLFAGLLVVMIIITLLFAFILWMALKPVKKNNTDGSSSANAAHKENELAVTLSELLSKEHDERKRAVLEQKLREVKSAERLVNDILAHNARPAVHSAPANKKAEGVKPAAKPAPSAAHNPAPTVKPDAKPAAKPTDGAAAQASKLKPEAKPAPTAKPEAKPTAKPAPTVKPDAKPAAKPADGAAAQASKPKPEAKADSSVAHNPASTAKPEAKPAVKPEAKAEAKPEGEAAADKKE